MSRTLTGTEYLSVASSPVAAVPWTKAAWVRSSSATANQTVLALGNSGGTTDWSYIGIRGDDPGDPCAALGREASTGLTATGSTYVVGEWTHLLAWFEADLITLWVNGVEINSASGTFTPETMNRLGIGALIRSTVANQTQGQVAEVAIWDEKLSVPNIILAADGRYPDLINTPVFYQSFEAGINQAGDIGTVVDNGPSAHSALHPSMNSGTVTATVNIQQSIMRSIVTT